MGISDHILGDRKLRKLSELCGLELDRAYIRDGYAEGRTVECGRCHHWAIDPRTGEADVIGNPTHWTSCDTKAALRQRIDRALER